MDDSRIVSDVNTNPLHFESLAESLATLASYAQGDLNAPFKDMELIFSKILSEPPGHREVTNLTGFSIDGKDLLSGRAAWLLSNVMSTQVLSVHTFCWHREKEEYYAPILDQFSRALGCQHQLESIQMQQIGCVGKELSVYGVRDNRIVLAQAITPKFLAESALSPERSSEGKLFRSRVFSDHKLKDIDIKPLQIAKTQLKAAFPSHRISCYIIGLQSAGPDFEIYEVSDVLDSDSHVTLVDKMVVDNSLSYADEISHDLESLFRLKFRIDNDLFRGIPPCKGGRTLMMLGLAAKQQMQNDRLLRWKRGDFIRLLKDHFDFEVENDKVRHDLDDRLVAQGFFHKWANHYYVSMKGIARYQYCLAKYTTVGPSSFDLDTVLTHRNRIKKYNDSIV